MSWQRIDENTYIDDTLVTCAEYQLFIDEMREQGKYYQPDHWTSYQISSGQAIYPILGVRYSDAVAFCEWLSRRENNKWWYRLPISSDRFENMGIFLPEEFSGGVWATEQNDQPGFILVGSLPDKLTSIVLDHTKSLDLFLEDAIEQGFDISADPDITFHLSYILNGYLSEYIHGESLNRIINLKFIEDRSLNTDRINQINIALGEARNQILNYAIELSRSYALSRRGATIEYEKQSVLNKSFDNALNLYLDAFILQERIGGYLPALEGILLIKTRAGE